MQASDLSWNHDTVIWQYNHEKVEIKIANIIFCSVDTVNACNNVTCGSNHIEEEVYLFSFDGNTLLHYRMESRTITWINDGLKITLVLDHIEQAFLYRSEDLVLILNGKKEKILTAYSLDGSQYFRRFAPTNYKFSYLSRMRSLPSVVCEAITKSEEDQFGRNQWHFSLDIQTAALEKTHLAY
ncbi:hypothetical protein [Virgibacillus halodenitrificans]|uniref:hypothetical protein n=1 Tax=Virgibacillus halodenitrificans TaxID=1482 RepID=UPI001F3FB873|nr:hypothetical protein [Virgibacillus halodenitrificans]